MEDKRLQEIVTVLQVLFPHTKTFLNYQKDYELLFAVILSAQATDNSVNKVTEVLFGRFKDLSDYDVKNQEEIYQIIKPLGLAKNKAEFLVKTGTLLREKYDGILPKDRNLLQEFPGVGYKTSGVVLAELYDAPYLPVDTHVKRVSERLGLVKENLKPDEIETLLEKQFGKYHLIHLHRQLILFGRNICKSHCPDCLSCTFNDFCRYYLKKEREVRK